jgi:hypothetical protein
MAYIRVFSAGMDSPPFCEDCGNEGARIVIEDFPALGEHTSLCQTCAADALSKDPKVLASAVVTLVLRGKPGRVQP